MVAGQIDQNNPYGSHNRPFYLAKYLSRLGVEVYIPHLSPRQGPQQFKISSFDSEPIFKLPLRYVSDVADLVSAVRKVKPDLLYAHEPYFGAPAALLALTHAVETPVVLDLHGSWRQEMQGTEFYGLLAATERLAVTGADLIIVASQELRSYVINVYGLESSRVAFVPNGVDPEIFRKRNELENREFRSKLAFGNRRLLLLTAPRGFPANDAAVRFMYSVMELLRRRGSDALLIITGGGPKLDGSPQNVIYSGLVPDLSAYISACDLGVMAYPDRAALGGVKNKVLEFFQCGLLVVSTKGGMFGIPEARDGHEFLLTEGNVSSFADKIEEALVLSERERNKIAKQAVQLVALRYNWKNSAELLLEIFKGWHEFR